MTGGERLVAVGRVGRAHGREGGFWVEGARTDGGDPLDTGAEVVVAGRSTRIDRREGSRERPLVTLAGVEDRAAAAALRDEPLLVEESRAPLDRDEWLAADLVGLEVADLGPVRRVLAGPSCDLLEVGDEGVLVPLVSDAVISVDVSAGRIEVDRRFLGLTGGGSTPAP